MPYDYVDTRRHNRTECNNGFIFAIPFPLIAFTTARSTADSRVLIYQRRYKQYFTDNLFVMKCATFSDSVTNM